jgi:hypothetical protein
VPTLDDDRFEAYLKQFRPIVPGAIPLNGHRNTSWRRLVLRSVGAAAVVILGVVSFDVVNSRVTEKRSNSASLEMALPKRPLTMRDANALLAAAPSYKAAVDNMAFHNQGSTIPKEKQSALAVLAKEKIKL